MSLVLSQIIKLYPGKMWLVIELLQPFRINWPQKASKADFILLCIASRILNNLHFQQVVVFTGGPRESFKAASNNVEEILEVFISPIPKKSSIMANIEATLSGNSRAMAEKLPEMNCHGEVRTWGMMYLLETSNSHMLRRSSWQTRDREKPSHSWEDRDIHIQSESVPQLRSQRSKSSEKF